MEAWKNSSNEVFRVASWSLLFSCPSVVLTGFIDCLSSMNYPSSRTSYPNGCIDVRRQQLANEKSYISRDSCVTAHESVVDLTIL